MYHGDGNCEWDLVIKATGTTLGTDSDGQRLQLESGIIFDLQATCVVIGTTRLNATISTTGKVAIYTEYSFKMEAN